MRRLILTLLTAILATPCHGAGLEQFAPAVEFTQVEWWRESTTGVMMWQAGQDGTPDRANIGAIREGRVVGRQEIDWFGGTYDIEVVKRAPDGVVDLVFAKGRLVMSPTHEGFYLVDIYLPQATIPSNRFRTSRKPTAHVVDGR